MEFEWDEEKRQQVIRERGLDLLRAARIFEGRVLTATDSRRDYGEVRNVSVGTVGDDCYVVVFTERKNCIRLITAWKGGRDDRRQYQESLARRNSDDG